ncbi:MAG: peptidoglycan-N-acetylglucosamine deacetylase [Thermoanaerobacteraceae bacterium]|jgi:peptidoglycan/xylan/chitin deacetylase (PgdA/CDA1 family)|nr:peptidoglycan-N-acetylglucosamine deacetylase [Thermoanaerobacteraceae bacterium]
MYRLWIIAALSYIIGGYFVVRDERKKYFLDFAKGYLTLLFSGLYLNSGLTYIFASAGVLAGHTKPIFYKFRGDTTEMVALGIVFLMSPVMGLFLFFCFLLILKLLKDYNNAVFVTSFLAPALSFKFFRSDSFIAITFIIFAGLAVQFWPSFLEKRIKPVFFTRMAFGLTVMGFLLLLYFNKYVYKGFGVQKDIIRHGPHHFKYVALTFDDGPDPVYTPEILDILKEKNVPATFFLIGKNVEAYPDIAKRIVREGHSIGNHTYTHKSLIPLSGRATWEEIKKAEKAIEDATGIRPTLFRPPRGVYSSYATKLLRDERYTIVLWDVSAMDWAELPPKSIITNITGRIKPGSIILLHDSGDLVIFKGGNRSSTVKALPEIIDNLRTGGYEFVTVDQMIFLTELMETEEQGYENNPRDNPY